MKKKFIAYLTAGDPTLAATEQFIKAVEEGGADILELGVPHSDPVADGPVNLAAASRALKHGTSLKDILKMVKRVKPKIPIVIFTYFNPVLQMGIEEFAKAAQAAGVYGALIVDLPPEEGKEYAAIMKSHGVNTIFLASPTTDPARLSTINEVGSGFLYYVSRTGVTGVQKNISKSLGAEMATVRAMIKLPIYVGFGISTPAQVKEIGKIADGAVVGSALVQIIANNKSVKVAREKLKKEVKRLSC